MGIACLASCVLILACPLLLSAAYANLLPLADGGTVYFEVNTGQRNWFQVRLHESSVTVSSVGSTGLDANAVLADVDYSGTVLAWSSYGSRTCNPTMVRYDCNTSPL